MDSALPEPEPGSGGAVRTTGRLVALVGPTASGKTSAAIAVARRMRVEVISADSRQVFRGMEIGTAAPNAAERAAVRHHLVSCVDPGESFTVVDWLERARLAIEQCWRRGALPLLVGGTGQYVWALIEGWELPRVSANETLRQELEALAEDRGARAVHERLRDLDPASAHRIEPANVRRVIRALEIIDATGGPVPPLSHRDPGFRWQVVGLSWPRSVLYERADARVAAMYAGGLLDETRALLAREPNLFERIRSISHSEASAVIAGEYSEAQAQEATRRATHRLIRAQANWFRDDDARIEWVEGANHAAVVAAVEAAAARTVV